MKNLAGNLIRMDDFPTKQFLVKFLIYRKQIVKCTVVIPMCSSFPWNGYTFLTPVFCLAVERQVQKAFLVHHHSDHIWRSRTVCKKRRWRFSCLNGGVIFFTADRTLTLVLNVHQPFFAVFEYGNKNCLCG